MPSHFLPSLLLLTAAGSLAAQQAWTVAADGTAQFLDITSAIMAAGDGDLIVVKAGLYQPITIDGKALTIVGPGASCMMTPPPATPYLVPPSITIRNLAANQHVQLVGMSAFNFNGAPTADLLLLDCAGRVWLEDVFCDSYGAPALIAERCADIVLRNSVLQTNLAGTTPAGVPLPGPGSRFVDCVVHAYDCQFRGAHGVIQGLGFPIPVATGDGGNGIDIVGSIVTLQGGQAYGSSGSTVQTGGCVTVGNGGDGIEMSSSATSSPFLQYRDFLMQHAVPFVSGPLCGAPPAPGVDLDLRSGQAVALPGRAHLLLGAGQFVPPATATVEVRGVPGDLVALFASTPSPSIDAIGLSIHIGPSLIDLGFSVVATNGKAIMPLALQVLPPGSPPFLGALQALVVETGGNLVTTGPGTIAIR